MGPRRFTGQVPLQKNETFSKELLVHVLENYSPNSCMFWKLFAKTLPETLQEADSFQNMHEELIACFGNYSRKLFASCRVSGRGVVRC